MQFSLFVCCCCRILVEQENKSSVPTESELDSKRVLRQRSGGEDSAVPLSPVSLNSNPSPNYTQHSATFSPLPLLSSANSHQQQKNTNTITKAINQKVVSKHTAHMSICVQQSKSVITSPHSATKISTL